MTQAATSILAYDSIVSLGEKQAEVLEKIEELQPVSNKQIARALRWEINRVTGRTNELHKLGLVRSEEMARNENGRLEKLWIVNKERK